MPASKSRRKKRTAAGKQNDPKGGTGTEAGHPTASASGTSNAGSPKPLTANRRISAMDALADVLKLHAASYASLEVDYQRRGSIANPANKNLLDERAESLKTRLDPIHENLKNLCSALSNNTACTEEDVSSSLHAGRAICEAVMKFIVDFQNAVRSTKALLERQNTGST